VTRDYELGFILNPEVSEDVIRTTLERIQQIVATYGGQIVKINHWGRRRLAYPIERHRGGYYIFIDMILTPETVGEIERTLQVSEDVMRHMMKRRDPKAVQKEREERAEREARAAAAAEAAAAEAATVPASNEVTAEVPTAETAEQAEVETQAAETTEQAESVQQPEEASSTPAEATAEKSSSAVSESSESSVEA
jgi:small subunit ribosomal protein S6